jgi:hypothetical protein
MRRAVGWARRSHACTHGQVARIELGCVAQVLLLRRLPRRQPDPLRVYPFFIASCHALSMLRPQAQPRPDLPS